MGLQLGTPQINTFSGNATPGKMEVLFEQWYHKVQCVKDHYPESVVRESIGHKVKSFATRLEGTLNQSGCSALEGSWIEKCNSTSRTFSFMGYKNI